MGKTHTNTDTHMLRQSVSHAPSKCGSFVKLLWTEIGKEAQNLNASLALDPSFTVSYSFSHEKGTERQEEREDTKRSDSTRAGTMSLLVKKRGWRQIKHAEIEKESICEERQMSTVDYYVSHSFLLFTHGRGQLLGTPQLISKFSSSWRNMHTCKHTDLSCLLHSHLSQIQTLNAVVWAGFAHWGLTIYVVFFSSATLKKNIVADYLNECPVCFQHACLWRLMGRAVRMTLSHITISNYFKLDEGELVSLSMWQLCL